MCCRGPRCGGCDAPAPGGAHKPDNRYADSRTPGSWHCCWRAHCARRISGQIIWGAQAAQGSRRNQNLALSGRRHMSGQYWFQSGPLEPLLFRSGGFLSVRTLRPLRKVRARDPAAAQRQALCSTPLLSALCRFARQRRRQKRRPAARCCAPARTRHTLWTCARAPRRRRCARLHGRPVRAVLVPRFGPTAGAAAPCALTAPHDPRGSRAGRTSHGACAAAAVARTGDAQRRTAAATLQRRNPPPPTALRSRSCARMHDQRADARPAHAPLLRKGPPGAGRVAGAAGGGGSRRFDDSDSVRYVAQIRLPLHVRSPLCHAVSHHIAAGSG